MHLANLYETWIVDKNNITSLLKENVYRINNLKLYEVLMKKKIAIFTYK